MIIREKSVVLVLLVIAVLLYFGLSYKTKMEKQIKEDTVLIHSLMDDLSKLHLQNVKMKEEMDEIRRIVLEERDKQRK